MNFIDYINKQKIKDKYKIISIEELTGGLVNKSYKITTIYDIYVAKVLNELNTNNIDKYENVDNYQIDKMSVNEIKNKFYQIINKKVENFIINNANSNYEFSICKFICSSKKKLNQIDLSKKNKYFCSELIACVYMYCNIMKKKYDPSTYLPKDFSEKGKIEFIND